MSRPRHRFSSGEHPRRQTTSISPTRARDPNHDWQRLFEAHDPDAIMQEDERGCSLACIAMLMTPLGIAIDQRELAKVAQLLLSDVAVEALLRRLDRSGYWSFQAIPYGADLAPHHLRAPWMAWLLVRNSQVAHAVIVDGVTTGGLLRIRDPWCGTSYKMTYAAFDDACGGVTFVRQRRWPKRRLE